MAINGAGDEFQSRLQLFVKLLNGETLSLQFPSPIEARSIKQRIHEITRIPVELQRLIRGHQLKDDSVISQSDSTLNLSLRLPGGKGGFGSLLRGAATKAGQKKTSNFDACRDMSGRRLRHVNAERRLEEWKEGAEERKLEKIAADFLKKKAKTGKKGTGDGEASKYVEKYREESAKCVAVVEESVKEAFKNGKRKALPDKADSKRLKIWMGKRKLGDDDMNDDSSEDEDDEEPEKSVVLNSGSLSDKGTDSSPGSVTGGASSESGSEKEKEAVELTCSESGEKAVSNAASVSDLHEPVPVIGTEIANHESGTENKEEASVVLPNGVSVAENVVVENSPSNGEISSSSPDSKSGVDEETVSATATIAVEEPVKPLDFNDYNAPKEMEALGMERLKTDLQSRGLKCGGTLQERASRLFLLKTTPFEKLPKKLLAKK